MSGTPRAPLVLRVFHSLRSGRSTVGALAADLGVTRRSIERALVTLEASGIVIARSRDREDARRVWIALAT